MLRNGRIVNKPIGSAGAWREPSPRIEAKACVRVALANGGLEAMRKLIAVSAQEKANLLSWATGDPQLVSRIEQAVTYREQVLEEFNRLAANAPAEIS
jgi:hypothetical protein